MTLLLVGLLVLASPAVADQAAASKHLQKARALQQKNRVPEAQIEFQQAIKAAPEWDQPYADQARFFMQVKNLPGARESWQAAIQRGAQNAEYQKGLAAVLESEGRLDEAEQAWHTAARLSPKDIEPLSRLAGLALKKGDLDKAQSMLDMARQLSPEDSGLSILQARIYIARQDHEAAVDLLGQILPKLEKHPEKKREAQKYLEQAQQAVSSRRLYLGLIVGVPLLLVVAGAVTYRLLRRVEIKPPPTNLDNSTNATVCRYVLDHVVSITGLPRALCWAASLDGRKMELQATELMRASELLARRELNTQALEKWIQKHGQEPFLFHAESRDLGFMDAFPRLVKDLEGVEMTAGVPLVWKGQFRGLLLLGRSRSAGEGDLRQRFEKSLARIQEVAGQGAQALEQLRQNHLRVYDVETGAYNKAWFDVHLAEAVQSSRSTRLPLSLLILRMDAFDGIQERHGDKVAGEVLVELVEALERCLREESKTSLVRLEGGVFAVLAPERGLREAPSLAQHLKAAVDSLKIARNLPLPTGCVAFAVFPDHADDVNSFRRVATRAFRDAVYLEGNRVLEAERGGAFDPEEDLDAGIRASGRRVLTGEAAAQQDAPAPLQPPGGAPFQPFSAVRKTEERGPAQDAGVSGISPLRSRYPTPSTEEEAGPSDGTAERQPLRQISKPVSSGGSGLLSGPHEPAPRRRESVPMPVPETEPPAPVPAAPIRGGDSDTSELADLGIDPVTQFCLQSTFEDLAEFEVRSGLEAGQPSSIVYIRLVNLADLKSQGSEEYLRVRRDLTALLQAFLRDEVDVPGLMGPDDFVLLLTGTDLATASSVANQVAMTVRNLQVAGRSASAAVGVACSHPGQTEGPALIQHARAAAGKGPGVHRHGSGS